MSYNNQLAKGELPYECLTYTFISFSCMQCN